MDNKWFPKPGVYRGLFDHGYMYGESFFTAKNVGEEGDDDDHGVSTDVLYCCATQPDHAVVASSTFGICTMGQCVGGVSLDRKGGGVCGNCSH
eukprot:m.149672 g.149672  ORF g.149672 m.149672 type:complete len:93 (+) comp30674_c1_seq2:869-1147(+)